MLQAVAGPQVHHHGTADEDRHAEGGGHADGVPHEAEDPPTAAASSATPMRRYRGHSMPKWSADATIAGWADSLANDGIRQSAASRRDRIVNTGGFLRGDGVVGQVVLTGVVVAAVVATGMPAATGRAARARQGMRGRCPPAAGRRHDPVGPDDDRARRILEQGRQAGGAGVGHRELHPPVAVGLRGPRHEPDQQQALPAAEAQQLGRGRGRGEDGRAAPQDVVEAGGRALLQVDHRVGDQAADPQVARERRRRLRRLCSAPPRSRGVAGDASSSRKVALRQATASATRRANAAASWPPVIAHPIATAFFTMAVACGRRSAS